MRTQFVVIACAFLLLSSLGFVSAERYVEHELRYGILNTDGTFTDTGIPVNNVDVRGYVCRNAECTGASRTLWGGSILNTGSDNAIVLEYPTQQATHGYGIIFSKEGYLTYEVRANFYGDKPHESRQHPDGPYTHYLTKKQSCKADILSVTPVSTDGVLSFTVAVDAPIYHPRSSEDSIKFVPGALAGFYESDVQLDIEIRKNGAVVFADTESVSIDFSESEQIPFSFAAQEGVYSVKIISSVPDSKCLSSQNDLLETTLNVTNQTGGDLPELAIVSPIPTRYTSNMVLVELQAENAANVWFNWNGSDVAYTAPMVVEFNEGLQVLRAFAQNSAGVTQRSVSFVIDSTLGDVTPPGQVSNLRLRTKGSTFITWEWMNPTDNDFSQAIILVDGVNVANTSNPFFTVGGLAPLSTHTISITTKDIRGNVNTNAVSDTQTTLPGNGNESDMTPPGQVSNLEVAERGTTFLVWNWTNPMDSDFYQTILSFDGVNVANTSGTSYRAEGLSANTLYTLCIVTQDLSGNINQNDVCNSARTRSSGGDGSSGSDDDFNHKKKKTAYVPPQLQQNETIPPYYEDEESVQKLTVDVKKTSLSIVALVLLIASLLVLIIILTVLIRQSME